jgi:hypothetical protein
MSIRSEALGFRGVTFEELLSEMQGMLSKEIIVAVLSYRTKPGSERLDQRMHVILAGMLRRGTDESDLDIVGDDGMAFVIGESEEPGEFSKVYLAEDSFRDAWRDDDGQLIIAASDGVAIQVTLAPTRAG